MYHHFSYIIQAIEIEYSKAQCHLFQENKVISLEIWPRSHSSWNYKFNHVHWDQVQRAKGDYADQICHAMQDSQDPYDLSPFTLMILTCHHLIDHLLEQWSKFDQIDRSSSI